MSTSFFSSQLSERPGFGRNSSSSGFSKEWQRSSDSFFDEWITNIDKKDNLASYPIATEEPQIERCSSQPYPTPGLGKSSTSTEDGSTSAFSRSLSQLLSSNIRLVDSDLSVSNSASSSAMDFMKTAEPDELFAISKEFESHAIGSLLPDDQDELLDGMTDELHSTLSSCEDTEDSDIFSSGGGMELETEVPISPWLHLKGHTTKDIWSGYPTLQHVWRASMSMEHLSRTLFVRNISSNLEESELRSLFEQYGDLRALHAACEPHGFMMVSYYDIRAARNAMWALQNMPLHQRKLDIYFSVPKNNPSDEASSQGTLVVFNPNASVSNKELWRIFGVYGEIKEIRETPHKKHHQFVEFYDVRAAEAALREFDRCDITDKCVKLELSHPKGARPYQEFEQDLWCPQGHQLQIAVLHPFSGSRRPLRDSDTPFRSLNDLPAPMGLHDPLPSPSNRVAVIVSSCSYTPKDASVTTQFGHFITLERSSMDNPNRQHGMCLHQNSSWLPEYHAPASDQSDISLSSNSSFNVKNGAERSRLGGSADSANIDILGFDLGLGGYFGGPSTDKSLRSGSKQYLHRLRGSSPFMSSPTHIGGTQPHCRHPFPGMHCNLGDPPVPGSAPSGNGPAMDMRHRSFAESPNRSLLTSGSHGGMGLNPHAAHTSRIGNPNFLPVLVDGDVDSRNSCGSHGLPSPRRRARISPHGRQIGAFMNCVDGRIPRGCSSSMQAGDKILYQLDIDRILRGEDPRTTLMIKNIPNKYKIKMLLAAIDEHHRGTYDFIYLPMDFKNKCNVGYAFINMVDPSLIVPLYEAFEGKKWKRFNSEKVGSLAYARIQGKAALITHFQNSSLMNEDKRCRPILFHTYGQSAGDQEPLPRSINIERMYPGSPSDSSSSSSSSEDDFVPTNVYSKSA